MSESQRLKKTLDEGKHDYIWDGVFDGIIGIFVGVFNTRIGLGVFLFLLGIFMMLARVADDDPSGLVTIRMVGILFLTSSVLLFRGGIREKRREREKFTASSKPPVRKSLRSGR